MTGADLAARRSQVLHPLLASAAPFLFVAAVLYVPLSLLPFEVASALSPVLVVAVFAVGIVLLFSLARRVERLAKRLNTRLHRRRRAIRASLTMNGAPRASWRAASSRLARACTPIAVIPIQTASSSISCLSQSFQAWRLSAPWVAGVRLLRACNSRPFSIGISFTGVPAACLSPWGIRTMRRRR